MREVEFESAEVEDGLLHGIDTQAQPFTDLEVRQGRLWELSREVIYEPELFNKIIFCNDILEITPAEVFLSLPRLEAKADLNLREAKFLNSFFDYIFKFIFNYQEKHTKRVDLKGLGTAHYYTGSKNKVKVIE